jgi:hypothetical protein
MGRYRGAPTGRTHRISGLATRASASTCRARMHFSLINRNSYDEVLDDAAMLWSSALVVFDSIAPGTNNAILGLTTTVARFRISRIMQPHGPKPERTQVAAS